MGLSRPGRRDRSGAIPADELALLESGRDLRPDTITPSPDITSSGVEAYETIEQRRQEVLA